MNAMRFAEAISEVDDRYYWEAARYRPAQRWVKWGVLAACLCLVMIGCFALLPRLTGSPDDPKGAPSVYPYVMVNGALYWIDPEGAAAAELPEGYSEIGKIEGNAPADQAQNWYSQGCKVGESVYQGADLSEVYVYTALFSGEKPRYLRFVRFDR